MTSTTAGRREGRRLRRGSLTPRGDRHREPATARQEGADGFSLPKLGRALGADPTAVYRHFASKDDLVLAIADRLIEEAHDRVRDAAVLGRHGRRWGQAAAGHLLRSSSGRRAVGVQDDAATRRDAGRQRADRRGSRGGVHRSRGRRMYRALGDFTLAWAGSEAAFLALDPALQETDRSAWTRAYLAVDRARVPEHLADQGRAGGREPGRHLRDHPWPGDGGLHRHGTPTVRVREPRGRRRR